MIKFENTEVFNFEGALRGMRNPMNSWGKSDSRICPGHNCDTCDFWRLDESICSGNHIDGELVIGPNDLDLAKRLIKGGSEHRKFLRQIFVSVDITAPLYWWKEADTYKVGTVANSCSTMHKIAAKEFTLEDFSCEHLEDEKDGWVRDENDQLWCSARTHMETTINLLNAYRYQYLETKTKPMKDEKARQRLMKKYWWQMIQLLPSSYNQKRTVTMNYENVYSIYKQRCVIPHKLDEWRIGFKEWAESLPYFKEFFLEE